MRWARRGDDDVRVCVSLRGRKTYFYRTMIRRNCYEALEKNISNFQGISALSLSLTLSQSFCLTLSVVLLRLDALLRQKPQETAGET